jgi:cytosine/adenosine deaminase-related metal-dependent hydrolase
MFEEATHAYYKTCDAGTSWAAEQCVGMLAGGQKLASELLGVELGTLNEGAEADLIVLDYDPPTPLHSGNLAWHFIFAMSSVHVRHAMIAGQWRLRDGSPIGLDTAAIQAEARKQAVAMWERMAALPREPMWPSGTAK